MTYPYSNMLFYGMKCEGELNVEVSVLLISFPSFSSHSNLMVLAYFCYFSFLSSNLFHVFQKFLELFKKDLFSKNMKDFLTHPKRSRDYETESYKWSIITAEATKKIENSRSIEQNVIVSFRIFLSFLRFVLRVRFFFSSRTKYYHEK